MIELLKSIRWFSGLDDDALQAVSAVIERAHYALGEVICQEGETGDRMFVIEHGDVAVL